MRQGVTATVPHCGAKLPAHGAYDFPARKPLWRKGLRRKPRQECESGVDICLHTGIMAAQAFSLTLSRMARGTKQAVRSCRPKLNDRKMMDRKMSSGAIRNWCIKHPEDGFLLAFYLRSTGVLPSSYWPPTAVVLKSCFGETAKNTGNTRSLQREENILVDNAKMSTSRDTHYHVLTLMTVTPPQIRKSVEKCRILWNRRTSPGRHCTVKGDSPRCRPPDSSSMNAPRTNLARFNEKLHRQAMNLNCIAATTSSIHAPTHRSRENAPAVRGAAVRALARIPHRRVRGARNPMGNGALREAVKRQSDGGTRASHSVRNAPFANGFASRTLRVW